MLYDNLRDGFEHIERLHGRLHMFLGEYADELIVAIGNEAMAGTRPYVQILEEAVNKVINHEIPRPEGGRNRATKGARKAVGHPWKRRQTGIRRTEGSD